jgi:hypothetical protein
MRKWLQINKTPFVTAELGLGNSRKTSFFLFFALLRLRVRPFRKASVRRPDDVRRLLPRYVRRGIPTEIHFRFHPPGEARQVPKSFPWAHWISLRGLPAIFQLRLIGSWWTGIRAAGSGFISAGQQFLYFYGNER